MPGITKKHFKNAKQPSYGRAQFAESSCVFYTRRIPHSKCHRTTASYQPFKIAHFNRVAVDVAALAPGDRNLFGGLHVSRPLPAGCKAKASAARNIEPLSLMFTIAILQLGQAI
jgi:hypothetical protein